MAEYKGKEVKLDDPFRLPQGSDKKFGVYVKNPKSGNVIMVKFGDPNLSIKRDDPERLKNFRARHNCSSKTDKTTPGYWSCKFWEKNKPVSKLLKKGKVSEEGCGCGCSCGCEEVNEEKQNFIKGWVNPRTKKIIAWNTMQPYHAKHIYDNLSKYGLTTNDLIDHYIAVLSKRSPKYKPDREELEKRFEQIGKNNMLADRDETLEYPAIKKGWVAFVLEDFPTGKAMTLRGIKKDIKKSGIMVLEKFKTFKDLDRILITNYKNTKFAEYTGKTKNEDERYTSNSEAMQFLFGRRPKRREPKTEIGRTMAMFREDQELNEVNIPGYKGWVNPKTGKTQIIQGHSPYHVMMIANNPRFYGLTEKLILNHLIETYKERDSPIPEEDAEFAMQRLKSGERDMDYGVELLAMERGWVRFVEGEYAEISGRKRFNDRELRKILQLIDKETPLTMKSKTTMGLQQYRPVGKTDVKVELYGALEMNEIKNLIKGRKKGDKQTEIGRTMAMFREWKDEKDEDVNEVYKDSGLGDWFGKGGGGGVEKGGWDRYNASGDRIGKCGDAPEGAAYSACLSAEKAKQLGKEGRAEFVRRKRDAQKKSGDKAKGGESKKGQKPVMVKTGAKGLDKKNESFMSFRDFISEGENKPNNPALWKKAIAKAKAKFDVYPSAYANAWASKWYKGEGGTWSKK